MPEAHEQLEHAEHAQHAAHDNKKIALVIAILALMLSFSERSGKGAQTEGVEPQYQGLRHLEFLPGKDHPQDDSPQGFAEGMKVQFTDGERWSEVKDANDPSRSIEWVIDRRTLPL